MPGRGLRAWEGVALGGLFQVVAVKLPTHPAGVVAQEGHTGVHHEGALFFAGRANGVFHGFAAGVPVRAVHREHFNAGEGLGKRGGVAEAYLRAVGADVPFVVLHQPNHGQLPQRRHVKRFGHFALGHRGVSNAAQ